ncbi:nascent polypeptide-associated complex subunit alpha, muscle-specific form isoform X2 [Fundulus heteroclitus]|uniref:nascent polypeptide-associated complex subunit alpha, muscle-specific form isoform X2 n=1 Tax=Fundulus heteroclitus TaxID=8078 RepID=UPI00165A5199|nr:nascent polypeptide-associated complex subunit alpha, muscle-specific form isoform X2 [Fundulus heteroclitus]
MRSKQLRSLEDRGMSRLLVFRDLIDELQTPQEAEAGAQHQSADEAEIASVSETEPIVAAPIINKRVSTPVVAVQTNITTFEDGTKPEMKRLGLDSYQCPFCPKVGPYHRLVPHLQSHQRACINYGGYRVYKCHLGCVAYGHYHCGFCPRIIIRKEYFFTHFKKCLCLRRAMAVAVPSALPVGTTGQPALPAGTTGPPALPGGTTGQPALQTGTTGQPALPAGTTGPPVLPGGTTGPPALPAGTTGQPALPAGTTGPPALPAGTTGPPALQTGTTGQPALPAGTTGPPALPAGTTGPPALQTGTTGPPALQTGTTGQPALPAGTTGQPVLPAGTTGQSALMPGTTGQPVLAPETKAFETCPIAPAAAAVKTPKILPSKHRKTRCCLCNLELLQKNLKVHIQRQHLLKTPDITANHSVEFVCCDEKETFIQFL